MKKKTIAKYYLEGKYIHTRARFLDDVLYSVQSTKFLLKMGISPENASAGRWYKKDLGIDDKSYSEWLQHLEGLEEFGRPSRYCQEVKMPNGRTKNLQINCYCLGKSKRTQRPLYLCITQDITDKKRMEVY
jgi:hypothetical protein